MIALARTAGETPADIDARAATVRLATLDATRDRGTRRTRAADGPCGQAVREYRAAWKRIRGLGTGA